MKPIVTVIDYGIGNLYSVKRALEICGADVVFASNPEQVYAANHLVLPGVGAFASGMAGLRDRGLIDVIRAHAADKKPLMGICLGMQMFFSVSEEFGEHEGLDLVPGRVRSLPKFSADGEAQKIPRIGWAGLCKTPDMDWTQTPLSGLSDGEAVYLVHSFAAEPTFAFHQLAFTWFGGRSVCTVVRCGSIIGCQFHPEKSGPVGLKILQNFLVQ